MSGLEDLSRDDLLKVVKRDQGIKQQLQQRIGSLFGENVELFGVVQELQEENQRLAQQVQTLTEIRTPDTPEPEPDTA